YAVAPGSAAPLHSNDGGATWQPTPGSPATQGHITALATAPQMLWVGTSNGEVWSSNDAGATFNLLVSPGGATPVSALAAGGGQLWLAAGSAVWASADAGTSWSPMTAPGGAVEALVPDRLNPGVLAASTDSGVYLSLPPPSAAWVELPAGLPQAPVTALLWDGGEKLWAATLGRGFWTIPLSAAGWSLNLSPASASTVVGSTVPLQARLTSLGSPIAGAAVTFSAGAGGAPWTATVVTDKAGLAQVNYPAPL